MNGSLKLLRGLFLFVVDDPLGRRVEKTRSVSFLPTGPESTKAVSRFIAFRQKKKKKQTATSRKIVTGGRRVPGRGRHSMDFPHVE